MAETYQDKLFELLRKDERISGADGKILKNKTIELALNNDSKILGALLKQSEMRSFFFDEIEGTLIFNRDKFTDFVANEAFLADSYTSYKNSIGLATSKTNYLNEGNDVVLNWPYKDCVLEGGQEKEDQKRTEVFWNEVLGADQRDVLLAPKVVDGFKRFDNKGEHELKEITEEDNLVIRGNNLLALYTLRARYAGKINLIYIDPPFNTGGDSFGYNDKFNHSTWLTFMKNRLEIAKELLAENGSIFVHIDHNEAHYLKVLLDEIFGRVNFINEIIWCYTGPGSPGMKQFNRKHDNIFWYSKNGKWTFNSDDIRVESQVHQGGFNNEMDSSVSEGYEQKGKIPEDWWKFAVAARIRVDGEKRTGYLTEKPYKLLERIIKATTNEGDLVLDFFVGSATTAWVANSLGRRYIAIEQLEDTQDILKERLKKAAVSNKSGFVYFHLRNDANVFIERAKSSKTTADLTDLFQQIKKSNFLSYRVHPDELREDLFKALPIESMRKTLIDLIDKNKLYVNYPDLRDTDYGISEKTIELNKWMQNDAE